MNGNNKIAIGTLLWIQATFLGSTFETWLPTLGLTMLASLLVFDHHRRHRSRDTGVDARDSPQSMKLRWPFFLLAMLVILAITLFWRLESQTDREINALSVVVDATAHWGLFCSLLFWGLRPNRGHYAMLGLGMLVLLFGVAGGGATRSMAAQTSIALIACVGFTVATQIIQGTARGSTTSLFGQTPDMDQQTQWMARTISLITISLILMTTGVVASVTSQVLPGIQQAVQEQLSESLDVVVERTGIGGTRYVRSGRLGAIREHMTANPMDVALVVDSFQQPGYLRGRVYDLYRRKRWISAARLEATRAGHRLEPNDAIAPSGDGTVQLRYPLDTPLQRFQLPVDQQVGSQVPTTTHLAIYNDPAKGATVFTPLATRWIEARSVQLFVNEHAVIEQSIDITKPYVAGVGIQPRRETLTPESRAILTTVPSVISDDSRRIAAEVCPESATARVKAGAVSRFFQSQWDYSLRPPETPSGIDPLKFFLQQRHPAHCEYFASATAAVLRAANVPTRYVTGYVVDEADEENDDIWLARNRDAHAWVEAYDDQTKRWFAVESTPGRTYQTVSTSTENRSGGNTGIALLDESVIGSGSLIGRAWGWLLSLRTTDALMVVYQFAQLPLFLFLVTFWWIKFRRNASDSIDEIDVKSLKMLRRVDRRVRKHSLSRHRSETLYQFADRINASETDSVQSRLSIELRRLADWYRQYADARYRGVLPQPFDS